MITLPEDTRIWRYMRLAPFIEMIMHRAIFQSRVSEFADPLEGAFGHRSTTISPDVVNFLDPPVAMTYHLYRHQPDRDAPIVVAQAPTNGDIIREARLHSCVTCWYHHDATESYAMWRVYGADSFALAVETTVGALQSAFRGTDSVAIGGIEYAPLPTEINSVHELFFHKRPEFSSEREVRSVQVFAERLSSPHQPQRLSPEQMNTLLASVIAAPGMRETMFQSLRELIVNLFRSDGVIFDPQRFRRSALDDDELPQSDTSANVVDHE